MKTQEFDYHLPKELIAQTPIERRDYSRLLILNRKEQSIKETIFKNIVEQFSSSDVLVLNNTEVIFGKIFGKNAAGRNIEFLLLKEKQKGVWEVLAKPSKKVKVGEKIIFEDGSYSGEVIDRTSFGGRVISFFPKDVYRLIEKYGRVPLPPYIKKDIEDPTRYQTVFAKKQGAIASPTAGLHFTEELLSNIIKKGVKVVYITLHTGIGTFRPIRVEEVEEHRLESEYFEISEGTAYIINEAKKYKRRIIACGTTVVRALESQSNSDGYVKSKEGWTDLFIYPGFNFKVVNNIITNFHLPKSTLYMLVCAFAGKNFVKRAYDYAIERRFRFYSFGDAMFIL